MRKCNPPFVVNFSVNYNVALRVMSMVTAVVCIMEYIGWVIFSCAICCVTDIVCIRQRVSIHSVEKGNWKPLYYVLLDVMAYCY